jgi:hypothetical protein
MNEKETIIWASIVIPNKYSEDYIVNEFMEFVWKKKKEDALYNIPLILKEYDRRKSFWQKLRELF